MNDDTKRRIDSINTEHETDPSHAVHSKRGGEKRAKQLRMDAAFGFVGHPSRKTRLTPPRRGG